MSIIGILGGGHIARMTTQAAQRLGANVAILDKDENSPAAQVTSLGIEGDWNDLELIGEFAQSCDVVSPETENVPVAVLKHLESQGRIVRPSSKTIEITRDRLIQKQALQAAGLPVVVHAEVATLDAARAFGEQHGYPFVLKTRTGGYDGRGNALVPSPGALEKDYERLSKLGELMAEQYQWFYRELAVTGVRGQDGAIKLYAVAETRCTQNIVQAVSAPAVDRFGGYLAEKGRQDGAYYFDTIAALAERVAQTIDIIGVFGIELFELRDGRIMINDVAPRPHVSGHWTIEGSLTSQFENHARALLGLPLGWTDMTAPNAATAMMLSRGDALPKALDFVQAAQLRGAHIHWYGKTSAYRTRKLGHVSGLASTDPEAERIAQMTIVALLGW